MKCCNHYCLIDIFKIIRGQLSLVNVCSTEAETLATTAATAHHKQYKFPIETYTGLDAATAERIKKFEAETKAMLTRSSIADPSLHQGRLSLDGQTHSKSGLYSCTPTVLYTVQCTPTVLYTVQCTPTVLYTVHPPYSAVYSVNCIVHSPYPTVP